MRLTIFLVVAAIFGNAAFAENATDYYLVQYSPGDNWQERTGYTEQPGLGGHHGYLQKLHINDQLVMGGKLRDKDVSVVVLRATSLSEAKQLVAEDPGVQNQVITAELSRWEVSMSSLRMVRRKPVPSDEAQSYHLKRIDPGSQLKQ
jgi:uncharacterized protein YciI